jgi:hypothetical protein
MSLATDRDAATPKERTDAAVRRICQVLGLAEVPARQLPELCALLAEIASNEVRYNANFRNQVKSAFDRALEPKPKPVKPPRPPKAATPTLTPIRHVDPSRFATYGPSDPYALVEQYGHQQLSLALKKFLMPDLRKSAALVEQHNPGAQLKPKATKNEVIDFIVQHVSD